jgi:hypothetical protein
VGCRGYHFIDQVMNGAVVATIIAPISIQIAQTVDADPRMLAM